MQGFRCKVTNINTRTARRLGPAKPAIWIILNAWLGQNRFIITCYLTRYRYPLIDARLQRTGNNMKLGFKNGAQTDIFLSRSLISSSSL